MEEKKVDASEEPCMCCNNKRKRELTVQEIQDEGPTEREMEEYHKRLAHARKVYIRLLYDPYFNKGRSFESK